MTAKIHKVKYVRPQVTPCNLFSDSIISAEVDLHGFARMFIERNPSGYVNISFVSAKDLGGAFNLTNEALLEIAEVCKEVAEMRD